MREAFALQKLLTFFQQKYWRIWDINVWNLNKTLPNGVVSFEQPDPVQEIINLLKFMDYLLVQADKSLYMYYSQILQPSTATVLKWTSWYGQDTVTTHWITNCIDPDQPPPYELLRSSRIWVYTVCTDVLVKTKYIEVFILNLPSSSRKRNKSKCIHFRNILRQEPVWLVFHMVWPPDCWVMMNIINIDGYVSPCRDMVALYLNVLCDLSLHEEYWAMAA